MTTDLRESSRPGGVWPTIIAPLVLTAMFGVTATFFVAKISADQERVDSETLRHEGYARVEAEDIAGRSRNLVQSFVETRLAKRRSQEKNLRLEVRGMMDAVHHLMAASLERTKSAAVARREVGDFPSGFEGVKNYLELSAGKANADRYVSALRASSPELSALLPSGSSLTVVENNYHEILSLGGGNIPGNAISETMTRDFFWQDGGGSRQWTLQVRLSAPDDNPVPDARELAGFLTEKLGDVRLDRVTWRGWLVDASGQAVAHFPAAKEGAAPSTALEAELPFVSMPRYWTAIDDNRLVWLERPLAIPGQDFVPAVTVAIHRPPPPLEMTEEFWKDGKWSIALGALAALALAGWIWFVRTIVAGRKAPPPPVKSKREKAEPAAGKVRQRLVRDETRARAVPEVQGVIVADIDDDGEVTVEAVPHISPPQTSKPKIPIPSGSLFRLQAIHRGGKGMRGSRVLDQARSQLLRDLAGRVRPVVDGTSAVDEEDRRRRAAARATEIISNMKSPGGWEKVE